MTLPQSGRLDGGEQPQGLPDERAQRLLDVTVFIPPFAIEFLLAPLGHKHNEARSHISGQVSRPTVCPSVASRNLLLYQSLPISILYRYALGRRRKDDTDVGTAARGIVE